VCVCVYAKERKRERPAPDSLFIEMRHSLKIFEACTRDKAQKSGLNLHQLTRSCCVAGKSGLALKKRVGSPIRYVCIGHLSLSLSLSPSPSASLCLSLSPSLSLSLSPSTDANGRANRLSMRACAPVDALHAEATDPLLHD
jgi:hypothetical protein